MPAPFYILVTKIRLVHNLQDVPSLGTVMCPVAGGSAPRPGGREGASEGGQRLLLGAAQSRGLLLADPRRWAAAMGEMMRCLIEDGPRHGSV